MFRDDSLDTTLPNDGELLPGQEVRLGFEDRSFMNLPLPAEFSQIKFFPNPNHTKHTQSIALSRISQEQLTLSYDVGGHTVNLDVNVNDISDFWIRPAAGIRTCLIGVADTLVYTLKNFEEVTIFADDIKAYFASKGINCKLLFDTEQNLITIDLNGQKKMFSIGDFYYFLFANGFGTTENQNVISLPTDVLGGFKGFLSIGPDGIHIQQLEDSVHGQAPVVHMPKSLYDEHNNNPLINLPSFTEPGIYSNLLLRPEGIPERITIIADYFCIATNIGAVRQRNEDCGSYRIVVDSEGRITNTILSVIDGVGGSAMGDITAAMLAEEFAENNDPHIENIIESAYQKISQNPDIVNLMGRESTGAVMAYMSYDHINKKLIVFHMGDVSVSVFEATGQEIYQSVPHHDVYGSVSRGIFLGGGLGIEYARPEYADASEYPALDKVTSPKVVFMFSDGLLHVLSDPNGFVQQRLSEGVPITAITEELLTLIDKANQQLRTKDNVTFSLFITPELDFETETE